MSHVIFGGDPRCLYSFALVTCVLRFFLRGVNGLSMTTQSNSLHVSHFQNQEFFVNRVLSFFLWSTLVNPNLKGTLVLILLTAISCIINSTFPFYNGTQARRVNILLILFPQPVGSSMRLFFRKPVIMFRTSPISSGRTPTTWTSLSCSTRTPLSLTQSSHIQGRLYEQRYLGYGLAHCSRPPETSISLWFTDCYFLLSAHSQCRG